jgi:hypothetical protein
MGAAEASSASMDRADWSLDHTVTVAIGSRAARSDVPSSGMKLASPPSISASLRSSFADGLLLQPLRGAGVCRVEVLRQQALVVNFPL